MCVWSRGVLRVCIGKGGCIILGVVGVQRSQVRQSYVRDPIHLVTVV